ncbi:CDGSH iron-sulfur domain-containing protein 3, mitochondrial [Diachasma alloeum]|uniref:CDGSH iron-sulfur domain-containing protein 3, mitochondrial n=1 Tax=Diachasma alloeum TaxID=454923 RepID=UPI00073846DF|nr:CDGSH iron-sulfur domain-containing protein 3, mitochondrial [Diachasma alloeum]
MMIVASLIQLSRPIRGKIHCSQAISRYSTKEKKSEPEIPKNELEGMFSAQVQPDKGKIYDKKPFKIRIEAGKKYAWCTCGHSKGQPLCDGTHKNTFLKITLRPIYFQVKETKEYWLCNCKQTNNRPFCDGTHVREDIQAKIK